MHIRSLLKNRIVQNASWIVAANIARAILTFVITMLTARYLGPSNYGLIGYAQSVATFAAPIALLGLGNIMVQELVDRPTEEGETIGTALVLSALSSLLCIGGVFAFARLVNGEEKETVLICLLYSLFLLFQSSALITYWFQARYMSKYASIVSLGTHCCVTAYRVFLLITGKSVLWFAVTNALDYMLISGVLIIFYQRLGGRRISFSVLTAKRLLSKSRYYIVTNMMIAIFAQTDRIMLKLMIDDAATGYYSAAAGCAGCAQFVYSAITDSARPSIFESQKSGILEEFEKKVSRLYSVIIYLSLTQSIVMTIFAPLFIKMLFGVKYLPSVSALRVLVWYLAFSEIGVIRNIWILAQDRQKWLWIINLGGAIANVALNCVLIPPLGIVGASIASVFAQFFTNVVMSYIVKPIRHNTTLMLRGLNPRQLAETLNSLKD